jgi:hypothetical protein
MRVIAVKVGAVGVGAVGSATQAERVIDIAIMLEE